MTSAEIRQSFLDFFQSKQHTIVPSSSLMPDAPNLLFTNAGMNQFVPIFLEEKKSPYDPGRAADTQKCIRAGGKHNDLEDVGLDTYHHTFFEMLGNWSFGDYFKKEAIEWAWELVTGVWKFPKERMYATVYKPGEGDPADFDQEAYDLWKAIFEREGLDPEVHIVYGNKKDNFWMMGETGPCGPCSELHMDLTQNGDTKGRLVNGDSSECIEIWNLVFIQFNANPDGTFSPLPAKHIDTGMGFERVASIIQCTKGFSDFATVISNYETDIFRPLFDALEKLSGRKYLSTLPAAGSTGETEQEKIDVAFRVIADHIRTLSFSIADGIQPGNTDRNYVLRRILRRAVRYGRSLGLHDPFFYKLVPVLAENFGDVFPEIRSRQKHVEQVIRTEEEAFNKTLDRGIALFESEVQKLLGSAPASGAVDRALAIDSGAKYSKRRLPHFERPWGKYMVTFSTHERRVLTPAERDTVMSSVLHAHEHRQYELYAACVMPDHVHLLFEPQIMEEDAKSRPVFWPLGKILHGIKSTTAHRINEAAGVSGVHVWSEENFDRLMRSDADLEEKFHYICDNPWKSDVVQIGEEYPWLWTPDASVADAEVCREGAANGARGGRAPRINGAFAFKLYDEQGFPLDLTELMARERGLSVDTDGFEELMEQQRERARKAQKKSVVELSQIETNDATCFVGFDELTTTAKVLEVVGLKDKTAVILDNSSCYAEMGGQLGDTGEMSAGGSIWQVTDTTKTGDTFLHFITGDEAPTVGQEVTLAVNEARRAAIQRHHTVTHLFHWALHEVVSREASQKGSYVGPEKLTFDFNCAALTPSQITDIERLVNERILENGSVSWLEMPYAEVKENPGIMQFFGDKYGDRVRVVQIGGQAGKLNGYSMELCGGTHTRATGEIGLFRIVAESAIAAGVRRIEAVAGLESLDKCRSEVELIRTVAGHLNSPIGELEKKVENLLAQQKKLEKELRALKQSQAAAGAKDLIARAKEINGVRVIAENLGDADADHVGSVADALKGQFEGVVVLGGASEGSVALLAAVSPSCFGKAKAGDIIKTIAPIVGGKGGGKPELARGGGKDASKLNEALAKVAELIG